MRRLLAMASTQALLATACADERQEATATTLDQGQGDSFGLIVEPTEFFQVTPGQLFVVLASPVGGQDPVVVSASVSGAATIEPEQLALDPGDVAELTPDVFVSGSWISTHPQGKHTAAQELRRAVTTIPEGA